MNRNVVFLAMSQALMMSGMSMMLTTAALTGQSLIEQRWLSTLPVAALFIAMMLTSLPAAWLMGRIGRKRAFGLGALFAIAGAGVAAIAILEQEFWWFVAGSALIGIYNGFGNHYRFAAIEVVKKDQKNRAVSLVIAGGVISALVGPNLAGWTHNMIPAFPFAGSYAALTGLYCLSILALVFIRFPSQERNNVSASRIGDIPRRPFLRQPAVITAMICGMFGYGVMNLLMTATPLAMSHHNHAFADTVFVIQWHALGMFAPAFFTGYLIDRLGIWNILTTGALLGVGCVVINLAGNTLWHYWAALLLVGVSWNFLFIGATILLTDHGHPQEREERARLQAINDFAVFSTVTLAALSSGALQASYGWRVVNMGVLPFLLVILVFLLWFKLHAHGGEYHQIPESARIDL